MAKTLSEIEQSLSAEFSKEGFHAQIKEIDGYDYIPWDESCRLANRVFGFMGWSVETVGCEQVNCTIDVYNKKADSYEPRDFTGFKAHVRLTVHAWDAEHSIPVTISRDGAGFAAITSQGNKNPMDTAYKAAVSDAFSRALKLFGDYFGLFLYHKEESASSNQGSSGRASSGAGKPATGRGGGARPTPGQLAYLTTGANDRPGIGLTPEQVERLSFAQWKPLLDAFFSKNVEERARVPEMLTEYGLSAPTSGASTQMPWKKRAS